MNDCSVLYRLILLPLAALFVVVASADDFPTRRVIQYDEGNFGKINLHDLRDTPVTTYSPVVYVKRPKYISELGERPLIDKQYKHNFYLDTDQDDSRYVYNYVDRDLGIFDLPEGEHLEPLVAHLQDRVKRGGVAEEPLYKRIKIARDHGLEVLLNYRLNDVHWGGPDPVRPELQSEFSLAHRDYKVNPDGNRWRDGALNFAIPEVQDYLLPYYEEGLNRFDNDGILIDMMRNPTVFPAESAWENREHLTRFLREVRKLVDRSRFAEDGRSMTLGLRVPPTVEYCEFVGMDVRTWAKEGLVDFFAVSVFMKQDPNLQVNAFREAIGPTNALFYATFQRRNYGFGHSASFGQYRGMAANMWGHEKADGLLLFNWMQQSRNDYDRWKAGTSFNGPHPDLVKEIGSLETLAKRNKVYSIAWGTSLQYPDLPFYNPLPIDVPRGESRTIRFGAYEDLARNTPKFIYIVVQANPDKNLDLMLNGTPCSRMARENAERIPINRITGKGRPDKNKGVNDAAAPRKYVYFRAPVSALIDGLNELEYAAHEDGQRKQMSIIRTDVFVGYGDEKKFGRF